MNGARVGDDESDPTLVVISAGSQVPFPAEMLGSQRFRDLLAEVSEVYDSIILDTAPLLSVVDSRELLPVVDGVLLCVRLFQSTDGEVKATKEAIGHFPNRPTGVVVTGIRPGDDADYGYYSYSYSYGSE